MRPPQLNLTSQELLSLVQMQQCFDQDVFSAYAHNYDRKHVPAGVPEPYNVIARENVDSALLVLSKARYDGVILHYPEQSDIILTNLLYQHGLSRDGHDVGQLTRNVDLSDDEGYAKLRSDIKAELQRSQDTALAELTYAASVGNIEQVENLLARGLPINAGVPFHVQSNGIL